ncbi:unnamed protein product [Durusdinium trenchii]|uniref:CS domain-containing protein n=1 Tax=Durusdinium trenchii TaxID=1381693 RepID=A0ABP0QU32_9DINO
MNPSTGHFMVLMEKAWVILETCFRSVNTYMFVEPKTGDIPFGVWVHPLARPLAPALEAIGERGAMCLAKALEVNPFVLETLEISENDLGEGTAALKSAFQASESMMRLCLGDAQTFEKEAISAVGCEGAPKQRTDPTRSSGDAFAVRCHRRGAEIVRPSGGAETQATSMVAKLLDMQQDEQELDLVLSVPGLTRSTALKVSLVPRHLTVTAVELGTLVDAELFDEIDPDTYEMSVRDGLLELSLSKAPGRGCAWPRLFLDPFQ